jgi:hypothetical protein
MRDLTDAAFYANDIHYLELKDNTFCENLVEFRAEIEGLHQTHEERIKWYIDGEEEITERNNILWSKAFSAGEYEIRMWVRYENNDTVSKTGTLKICSLDASFYANEVLHETLQDTTFCNKNVNFLADVEPSTKPSSLMWFIDYGSGYEEETSAQDQKQWSKSFENGVYPIKMWVRFENDETTEIESTLKVQALWIKMRNIRY